MYLVCILSIENVTHTIVRIQIYMTNHRFTVRENILNFHCKEILTQFIGVGVCWSFLRDIFSCVFNSSKTYRINKTTDITLLINTTVFCFI